MKVLGCLGQNVFFLLSSPHSLQSCGFQIKPSRGFNPSKRAPCDGGHQKPPKHRWAIEPMLGAHRPETVLERRPTEIQQSAGVAFQQAFLGDARQAGRTNPTCLYSHESQTVP